MEKADIRLTVIKALVDGDIIGAEALDLCERKSNTEIEMVEIELERDHLKDRERER